MATFRFELLTTEQGYPPRDVTLIDVPAYEGRLTVEARHEPLICRLRAGKMTIAPEEGPREDWRIGEGTLVVKRDVTTMLVRTAEKQPTSQ